MQLRIRTTGLLIGLLFSFIAGAMPIGSWNVHLPYYECKYITQSTSDVWTATDNSLFRLSKSDFTTEKITKIEGLSDLAIGALDYNPYNGALVIGYQNGNLDIIKGATVYNLPDIKRSQIVANKSIKGVYFIGPLAYVSTGFGIVVVDTDRNEISDTYLIGLNGSYLAVNDITSDGISLYAATAAGVYTASLSNPFLANYASWTLMSGLPTGAPYNCIEIFNGEIVTSYTRLGQNIFGQDYVWHAPISNPVWDTAAANLTVKEIQVRGNDLYVADAFGILRYDVNYSVQQVYFTLDGTINLWPNDLVIEADGTPWYADNFVGCVHMLQSWQGTAYRPNGPVSISAAGMDLQDGRLCVVPGGRDDAWNNIYNHAGISFYQNNWWDVMKKEQFPALDSLDDINVCEFDPNDNNHVWLGSWGKGLVEIQNNQIVNIYSHYNSILERKVEYSWCGIGGIRYDEDGNLWMVNSHTMKCLKVKKADNTWAEFDFQGLITTGTTVGNLMITENGYKWMIIPRTMGMIVFDDNGTIDNTSDDRKKKLGFTAGTGGIPGTDVLCMAEDKDNEVWIGTDKGIAVFYCAENIFNSGGCDAQQILIQQGEYTQILMESQIVTAIAVDGANRKWIGTESGGVFLMSEDGTEEILHFTADNSPLLSDNITGITIDPESGEVFFSTGKGIISYKSDAVEGGEYNGDVYAYPNPVRPDYHGKIAITGLVRDADVKITDIGGNVVYQTTALGGQAIWDGNNFKGERAASGVYLVFITNEDGTSKKVTKILLMN
jgi:ligand-binding sensor domain-containing protein